MPIGCGSLVPSLLGARQTNESLANPVIELFEIAHVYLPQGPDELPSEELMLGLTSGGDFFGVKGLIERIGGSNPRAELEVRPTRQDLLDPQRAAELHVRLGDARQWLLGYPLGEVTPDGLKRFELRSPTTVAEIKLSTLSEIADLIPQYHSSRHFRR